MNIRTKKNFQARGFGLALFILGAGTVYAGSSELESVDVVNSEPGIVEVNGMANEINRASLDSAVEAILENQGGLPGSLSSAASRKQSKNSRQTSLDEILAKALSADTPEVGLIESSFRAANLTQSTVSVDDFISTDSAVEDGSRAVSDGVDEGDEIDPGFGSGMDMGIEMELGSGGPDDFESGEEDRGDKNPADEKVEGNPPEESGSGGSADSVLDNFLDGSFFSEDSGDNTGDPGFEMPQEGFDPGGIEEPGSGEDEKIESAESEFVE